ncbi:hypothetical protein L198_05649 [Cryptococcus wingfieldii CBS 7118]|uniref:Uncharacterized protein n=1 Tax=Cryptococcus wingfieldii CBS 7118 TaxID=1295528 RepID=A0A1E3IWB2_9TREE|nr:hypothetical protein L198_05649 [Cryptococcus wingfieldii CBS 7118]ODN92852.1 hypothetical protein L198_05649 [Cryptococcus wingfieldii CBS 7118]
MSVDRLYVFNPLPESATEIQTIIMDLFSDFSQQEMDHLTSSSSVQKTSVKELESQLGSLLLHNVHDLGEEGSKVATIEERAVEEEEDEEEAEGQYDNVEGVSLEDMAPPERFHFEDWERLGQYDNVEGVSLEDMALPERFHFEDWERVQNDLEEIFQSAWDAEVNDAAPP